MTISHHVEVNADIIGTLANGIWQDVRNRLLLIPKSVLACRRTKSP